MMPVPLAPEPADFRTKVWRPGQSFLAQHPQPNNSQWNAGSYWRMALEDLHRAYNDICAYCSSFTPRSKKPSPESSSVDHFVPKSVIPSQAYEWDNFRLCRSRLNQRKDNHQDVLDPFALASGWFHLNFLTFLIRPNPALSQAEQDRVNLTLGRLKLNLDNDYVDERRRVVQEYCLKQATFAQVSRRYPFIASEMARQNFDTTFLPRLAAGFTTAP